MGTVTFPGVKSGRDLGLTPHPLLMPWSRKGRAIPVLGLWAVQPVQSICCTRVHFTLFKLPIRLLLYSSWNVMAHVDAREEKWSGKLSNAVGSQYPSHYLGTCCIQHYYSWCTQLGCQQSTELTPTGRFNTLALELDIYSLHMCKMWIFYDPTSITLRNTRHFVQE